MPAAGGAAAAHRSRADTSRRRRRQRAAPAGATLPARAEGPLQEVVVTATRREESLSKVPISVTALTQDDMDMKGIKDFQDIVRFTPGVTIDNSGTNAISIRGISSSAGAGTTGIYLDDTPIQMRNVGFNPDDTLPKTFDLDRVEVLRGPQGTLFGAGSEGGTVRYILTQPSLTTASTYVRTEASYTEYGQPSYEFGVAHGGPIIDGTLGFRASAWYRYDGGWIDRVDPTTGAQTEAQRQLCGHGGAAPGRHLAAGQRLHGHAQHHLPEPKKHDQLDLLAGVLQPRRPASSTPRPRSASRLTDEYYLPALKLQWDLGKTPIISNSLLLPPHGVHRLPGHGLRPGLLPEARLAE